MNYYYLSAGFVLFTLVLIVIVHADPWNGDSWLDALKKVLKFYVWIGTAILAVYLMIFKGIANK